MKDFVGGVGKVQIKEHPRGLSGLFVEVPGIWLPAEQRLPRVELETENDASGLPVLLRVRVRFVLRILKLSAQDYAALAAARAAGTSLYVDFFSGYVVNGAPWWVYRVRGCRIVRVEPIIEAGIQSGGYEVELAAAAWNPDDLIWYNGFPAVERIAETASGGQGDHYFTYEIGSFAGWVRLDYNAYDVPDQFQLIYNGQVVADTGGTVSGAGSLYWYYPANEGDPTTITVHVYAPIQSTAWVYTFYGPDPDDAPPSS